MDFSVDLCHRRPVTRRRLFYLDTSTFGALARGDDGADQLAAVLRDATDEGSGICVGSPWHDDEIAMLRGGSLLDRMVQTLRTYTLDVRMRFRDDLIDRELEAAAREFSGQKGEISWKEAFRSDPDEPPLKPFQAEYLNNRDRTEYPAAVLDEVSHHRTTSELLTSAHTDLRNAGLDWETVAQANLEAQVRYLLGPIADPGFTEKADDRQRELVREWIHGDSSMGAGSPTRRYLRSAHIATAAMNLVERYPAIAQDPDGFCRSDAVRNLPTIRLFPFLLAALSVDGRRTNPQASDLHDLWHLTYGLSRCDIVTADRRTCELARGRDLIPDGVMLLEAHELREIARALAPRQCPCGSAT